MGIQWDLFSRILKDGMQTGYLLMFCKKYYCAENFEFLLAVKNFNDLFGHEVWEDWKVLDNFDNGDKLFLKHVTRFDSLFDEAHCKQIEKQIEVIWGNFIDPSSATVEVCLAYDVIENTRKRIIEFKAYGPGVFAEATLEPTKSLIRDIMPRFMLSSECAEMHKRVEMTKAVYSGSRLFVPPPSVSASEATFLLHCRRLDQEIADIASNSQAKTVCMSDEVGDVSENDNCVDVTEKRKIALYINDTHNYVHDLILYQHMLVHLQRLVASENLLIIRAIEIFEQCMKLVPSPPVGSTKRTGIASQKLRANILEARKLANKQAWFIYKFFLLSHSPFEVSCSHNAFYQISLHMCSPVAHMFDEVYFASLATMESQFQTSFKNSVDYLEMEKFVKKRLTEMKDTGAFNVETKSMSEANKNYLDTTRPEVMALVSINSPLSFSQRNVGMLNQLMGMISSKVSNKHVVISQKVVSKAKRPQMDDDSCSFLSGSGSPVQANVRNSINGMLKSPNDKQQLLKETKKDIFFCGCLSLFSNKPVCPS